MTLLSDLADTLRAVLMLVETGYPIEPILPDVKGVLERVRTTEWPEPYEEDRALPEDAAIDAAFPTRSGRHDLYAEAMRLVGARRSKGGLVALVNWLLVQLASECERGATEEREAVVRHLRERAKWFDEMGRSPAGLLSDARVSEEFDEEADHIERGEHRK